jgi:hypothetical protein
MRTYIAPDRSVAVDIEVSAIDTMLVHCRTANFHETGGVLLGHYSPWLDRAFVTMASGPPRDSVLGAYTFIRGVAGLSALFARAWLRGEHYLGDWHFHPHAPARPSAQDLTQMHGFASDPNYQCRRTVLVIMGGDPDGHWSASAHVIGQGSVIALDEKLAAKRAVSHENER